MVTFQQGAYNAITGTAYRGAQDTTLGQRFPFDNGGGRTSLNVGTSTAVYGASRTLLQFDVSALAGQYRTINSLTLRLTYAEAYVGEANTAQLFAVAPANAGWVESSENGMDGIFDLRDWFRSTWRFRVQGETADTGIPWAGGAASPFAGTAGGLPLPGVDYLDGDGNAANGVTPLAARSSTSVPLAKGTTFDLTINDPTTATALIDGWLAGGNAGLLLRSASEPSEVASQFTFASKEMFNASPAPAVDVTTWRPQLTVDYAVPEPGSAGLFVAAATVGLVRRRRRVAPALTRRL